MLSALHECLTVADNLNRVPPGLHKQLQLPMQNNVFRMYRWLADYLECCVVVVEDVVQLRLDQLKGTVRRWPGLQLIRRSIQEAQTVVWMGGEPEQEQRQTKSSARPAPIGVLPTEDYFFDKVRRGESGQFDPVQSRDDS